MKFVQVLFLFFAVLAMPVFVHAQAGVAVSSYNADPSPTSPGEYFTLFAYVTNNNSIPAKDIVFTLQFGGDSSDTSFPFSIEPTDTLSRELGNIPSYTTVQVKYKVQVDPAALDGTYTVSLRAGPRNSSIGSILYATIDVSSRAPVLSIIRSDPVLAQIGETVNLQLTLKNTGTSRARDIQVGLAEDRTVTAGGAVVERDIVPLGSSNVFVGSLEAGATTVVVLPIQVNPSASSKAYFIPISLTFYDGANEKNTLTTSIGLKVSGDPQLNAYVSDAVPLAQSGKKSRLTVDLYNIGLGPAKVVTISILPNDVLSVSQTNYFIGTIESDDFDSVAFDAVLNDSVSSGLHDIPLLLHYKNEFGEEKSVTKNVELRVFSSSEVSSENGSGSPYPLVAGVIAVLVLIWWFRFRKPKNGNGSGNGNGGKK